MDSLKLGLIGLPDAETKLVATLFRLHGVDRSFIWSLAKDAPFDAVLVDANVPDVQLRAAAGKGVQVRRLLTMGVLPADNEEMARPIRSDHLVDWLNAIEVQILHGGGDSFASTNVQAGQASSLLPVALQGAPSGFATARAGLAKNRIKLKRWPPPALLAADVVRIRAATLLSRRMMTLAELSEMSKMSLERCQAFAYELLGSGLLDVSEVAAQPAGAQQPLPPLATKPASNPGRAGFGHGLISSIRRRFGLG